MAATNRCLDVIGAVEGTDKSSLVHGYLRNYERVFRPFQDADINIIEIGVGQGGSLRMWQQFFTRATIIGVDISPAARQHQHDRLIVEIGSQDDPAFLAYLCQKYPPTIVIDDGSHKADHILCTLEHIFPAVLPGGCFVIEDLFVHYGADAARMRGNSAITPQQYLWDLTERLLGAPQAPKDTGVRGRLVHQIDRIEFIKRAALLWKSEDAGDPLAQLGEIEASIQGSTNPDAWDFLAAALMRISTAATNERAEAAIRRALELRSRGDRHHYRLSILRLAAHLARLEAKGGHENQAEEKPS